MRARLVVTGQRPLSPVVLAAGEACGAVADGGLSTRKGKGREIPGGNQRRRSAGGTFPAPQAPTKEGLDRPERTRTIRQDSSQTEKSASTARAKRGPFQRLNGLRPALRGRSQFSLSKRKLSAAASLLHQVIGPAGISPKRYQRLERLAAAWSTSRARERPGRGWHRQVLRRRPSGCTRGSCAAPRLLVDHVPFPL